MLSYPSLPFFREEFSDTYFEQNNWQNACCWNVMSFTETLAFDDPRLAGELFGPLNANLDLWAIYPVRHFRHGGAELAVTSAGS